MKNDLVAQVLVTIANLEEIRGEEAFKAAAYRRAASYIHKMSEDIEDIARNDKLEDLPGVGKNIASKIRDVISTGTTPRLEKLYEEVPSELLELLRIPGLGPRTASRLYKEAGVKGVAELDLALRDGRVASLRGFGDKKAETLRKGLLELGESEKRYLLSYAWPVAEAIANALRLCAREVRAEVAGSIRRRKETVKDVDIVAACTPEAMDNVLACFTGGPGIGEVVQKGPTKASIRLLGGMQVDLRVVQEDQYYTALHHFTGSKEHNAHLRGLAKDLGLKINEYGVFGEDARPHEVVSEAALYALLGMEYIPPEMREDTGEIEASLEGRLPDLVELADIRGDLHCHTTWTDGIDDIGTMVSAAQAIGYEYLAITDHSKALAFARGLNAERLREQCQEISALNERLGGFRVLRGIEVDILPDGSMDLPDEVLSECDVVVASIHSGFRNDEQQIWRRLEAAMNNPHIDIIGHPTGRVIGHRTGYPVDMHKLVGLARDTGTVLEINASPDRLDMTDLFARKAQEAGVLCSISTDAHSRRGFHDMAYGVAVARRGWLTKSHVLNTLPLSDLLKRLG